MTNHATTTPIPPGIEVSDQVQTRLGTLRFFDGFPDEATTRVLFDNLDFQRAVQAYPLGLAPVDMAVMRQALLAWTWRLPDVEPVAKVACQVRHDLRPLTDTRSCSEN